MRPVSSDAVALIIFYTRMICMVFLLKMLLDGYTFDKEFGTQDLH